MQLPPQPLKPRLFGSQVLVTAADWPLRKRFLAYVRAKLNALSQRVAFYPGSEAKYAAFKARWAEGPGVHSFFGGADGCAGLCIECRWVAASTQNGCAGLRIVCGWVKV